jgi:tripartite ATP-independent transporter DctM subunit
MCAVASFGLVQVEREFASDVVPGLPVWWTLVVLPFAFGGIALRQAFGARGRPGGRAALVAGLAGCALGAWYGMRFEALEGLAAWPGLVLVVAATLAGAPLFVGLAGSALWLFAVDGGVLEVVPSEIYGLASSPFLAAIPLFTLAGFLMAQGRAPERLVAVFRAGFGWVPGGTAVVAAIVCTFFTAFTGGSGVTILALGGLLMAALRQDGYGERFSLGLLTGVGSLGLLFPPALPLILYGIAAEVPIEDLFKGGVLPGVVLLGAASLYGLRASRKAGLVRTPFDVRVLARAAWGARFELLVPVVAVGSIFGGFATLVEASALTAAFCLVIQLVRRDVRLGADLLRVSTECIAMLGGVLIILCVAKALTYWLVDAEIPMHLLEWVQAHVSSRLLFLLGLNVFLIVVGCLMDVYSATFVVVPLVLPLARAYGIDPVHMGILFVANLELGFLTPPVGLNLFVASYRFEKPLTEVVRASLPMFLVLVAGVLVITYWPWLSTALL